MGELLELFLTWDTAGLSWFIYLEAKEQQRANTWSLIKQGLLEGSMIISYYLFYHNNWMNWGKEPY